MKILKLIVIIILILFSIKINAQTQWLQTNGPYGGYIHSLGIHNDSIILAGTFGGGIYKSSNYGQRWKPVNNGIPLANIPSYTFNCFTFKDKYYFTGSYDKGVFRSEDGAENWIQVNNGLTPWGIQYAPVSSFGIIDSTIFIGMSAFNVGGIYKSSNNGGDWTLCYNENILAYGNSISIIDSSIFISTRDSGIFISTDKGTSWIQRNNGLPTKKINTIISFANKLYASIDSIGLYYSENLGQDWFPRNNGISNIPITSIAVIDSIIVVGYKKQIYKSNNNGISWNLMTNGISDNYIDALNASSDYFFAGTHGAGVFKCHINDTMWHDVNNKLSNEFVNCMVSKDNILFAGTRANGIYSSVDSGKTWILKNNGLNQLTNKFITQLGIFNNKIIVGSYDKGIFTSTDNGEHWIASSFGVVPQNYVTALEIYGTDLFCSTHNGGIFYSVDGINWGSRHDGMSDYWNHPLRVLSIKINQGKVFAGTESNGLFVCTVPDISWTKITNGLAPLIGISCIAALDSSLFIVTTTDSAFYSNNNGNSWQPFANIDSAKFIRFYSNDTSLIATTSLGIYYTKNKGLTWIAINEGLNSFEYAANSVLGFNGNLYLGNKTGVWKRTKDQTYSDIIELNNQIKYFPNPCNENLMIINSNNQILTKITIYDITGKITFISNFIGNLEIDVSKYQKGFYLIKFTLGETNILRKLIIN